MWLYLQFFNFLISCLLCVCQMIVDFLLWPKNEPKQHTSITVTFWALFTQTQCLETHMRPTPSYSRVLSGNEAISVCVSRACFWTLVSWSICRSANLAFCCVSITFACSSVNAYRERYHVGWNHDMNGNVLLFWAMLYSYIIRSNWGNLMLEFKVSLCYQSRALDINQKHLSRLQAHWKK